MDTLLLDKTGTITLGDRSVEAILPLPGIAERDAAEVAYLASLSDDTPEGRSIVAFAERRSGFRPPAGEMAGDPAVQRRDPDERRDASRRHRAPQGRAHGDPAAPRRRPPGGSCRR